MRLARGVVGALIGAVPGLIVILVAQYGIEGEMQLTVGVAGFWLVAGGALVGLIVALQRKRRSGG